MFLATSKKTCWSFFTAFHRPVAIWSELVVLNAMGCPQRSEIIGFQSIGSLVGFWPFFSQVKSPIWIHWVPSLYFCMDEKSDGLWNPIFYVDSAIHWFSVKLPVPKTTAWARLLKCMTRWYPSSDGVLVYKPHDHMNCIPIRSPAVVGVEFCLPTSIDDLNAMKSQSPIWGSSSPCHSPKPSLSRQKWSSLTGCSWMNWSYPRPSSLVPLELHPGNSWPPTARQGRGAWIRRSSWRRPRWP